MVEENFIQDIWNATEWRILGKSSVQYFSMVEGNFQLGALKRSRIKDFEEILIQYLLYCTVLWW